MKKYISKALCLVLLLSMVITGCGQQSSNSTAGSNSAAGKAAAGSTASASASGKKVTVEFWTISMQPMFTDLFNQKFAEYEKANPNVTIKWVDLPYEDIQTKLVAAIAGGTAPDVVNLNTQMALSLAGKNALVDLNKEATAQQKSIYIQSLYNSAKIGNSVYAFPWYAAPDILLYNTDLMKKAGITEIPATYDEANKYAEQMKQKTGAYLYTPAEFFNLLFEYGIPVLNKDNTAAAFNTQKSVDLLNSFKTYTQKDILPKTKWGSWDEEMKLYETGKLAILSTSGSALTRIKDEAPDVYAATAVGKPLKGTAGISRNALMNIVVPSASKNHEEAIKFAAYITNDENQLAIDKKDVIFPSTIAATKDSYFTSDTKTIDGQARAMSVSVSTTSEDYSLGVENQNDIQTAVNKAFEAAITSGKDTKESLKNAEDAVNQVLK